MNVHQVSAARDVKGNSMTKKLKPESPPEEQKFETALGRLEKIVTELEDGDLNLDRSLALFEEGVGLSRICMKKLDEAQSRVELLLKDPEGAIKRQPLESDDGEDGGGVKE